MTELPFAKKALGQHWLTDSAALAAICDAGQVSPGDHVLEIGPGTGTLTEFLLAAGAHVTAVELDKSLAGALSNRFSDSRFYLIEQDILKFDFGSLPPGYKVVANIPYYLTSNLIRVLSETSNQASRVVLLVQKEVAERVGAKPGGMSLLSVSAQFYWEVLLGLEVPARLFTPPPKVDSQILILERRNQPLFPLVDEKVFFQLVKAGFAARRKTLLNSLAGGLRTDKTVVQAVLDEAYILSDLRPQTLSLEQWHMLYLAARTQGLL